MSNGNPRDPDDFFAETRMSFGDHIEELRFRLFRAIAGFIVALIFSFFIGKPVLMYISAPVETELRAFYNRRLEKMKKDLLTDKTLVDINKPTDFVQMGFRRDQLEALLKGEPTEAINQAKKPVIVKAKKPPEEEAPPPPAWKRWLGLGPAEDEDKEIKEDEEALTSDGIVKLWTRQERPADAVSLILEAIRRVGEFDTLATLSVTEAFMVYFKVCLLCGLVLGSPIIFYQVWAFIAAGLYPNEKKLVHVYLPISLGLFLAGVFMCEIFVIPRAIEALLWFNEWIGLKPDLRLNEWLSFALMLPLVFGISFQTPLVMMFMARIGFMTADKFRELRKIAWFALAVFAAIITPTPDAVSMLMLWVPMILLYELGIWLVSLSPRVEESEEEDIDADRLVEV